MLTKISMRVRIFWRMLFLLFLFGCSTVPQIKPSPEGLLLTPEAPFARSQKTEIPAEAKGLSHFLKGQLLLTQGQLDDAVKEFEAAAEANPSDAFLRFR